MEKSLLNNEQQILREILYHHKNYFLLGHNIFAKFDLLKIYNSVLSMSQYFNIVILCHPASALFLKLNLLKIINLFPLLLALSIAIHFFPVGYV